MSRVKTKKTDFFHNERKNVLQKEKNTENHLFRYPLLCYNIIIIGKKCEREENCETNVFGSG